MHKKKLIATILILAVTGMVISWFAYMHLSKTENDPAKLPIYSYDINDPANYYDVKLSNNPCLALSEVCGFCRGYKVIEGYCRYYKPDKAKADKFFLAQKYYYCTQELAGAYSKKVYSKLGYADSTYFDFQPNNLSEITQFCREG